MRVDASARIKAAMSARIESPPLKRSLFLRAREPSPLGHLNWTAEGGAFERPGLTSRLPASREDGTRGAAPVGPAEGGATRPPRRRIDVPQSHHARPCSFDRAFLRAGQPGSR